MIQKSTPAGSDHGSKDSHSGKRAAPDSANQLRATSAAKHARIEEAGLGGNRTGESSASVKRAQASRDAKAESVPTTSAPPDSSPDDQSPETHSIQVQVNTDHNIKGSEKLSLYIQGTVDASLGRFGRQITRVEIHLSDDNAGKSNGDDKRCLLEARPAGMQPVVVTHVGATIDEAVEGAVETMQKLLDKTFAKLHDPKGRVSLGEDPTV